ncbi:hypothetical protein ACTXJX_17470 [Glutamicibacter ardleyensis]|uniref:hypothetical protein n=1 Tax=Glutamicibacter ardleyensis TaxID=225894 RepID=UPI003FD07970
MTKLLISFSDDVADRLRSEIPKGELSNFVSKQVENALDTQKLRSLDEAIAHIKQNDKSLLDRLGNVS